MGVAQHKGTFRCEVMVLGCSHRLRCDCSCFCSYPPGRARSGTRVRHHWSWGRNVLRERNEGQRSGIQRGKYLIRNNSSHQAQTIDSKLASGELFRHHGSQINRQKVRIESWQLFKWFAKVDYAQDFPRPYKGSICFAASEYSPCMFLPLSSMLHSVVSLQYMIHKMFFLLSAWGWAGWLTLLRKTTSKCSV